MERVAQGRLCVYRVGVSEAIPSTKKGRKEGRKERDRDVEEGGGKKKKRRRKKEMI